MCAPPVTCCSALGAPLITVEHKPQDVLCTRRRLTNQIQSLAQYDAVRRAWSTDSGRELLAEVLLTLDVDAPVIVPADQHVADLAVVLLRAAQHRESSHMVHEAQVLLPFDVLLPVRIARNCDLARVAVALLRPTDELMALWRIFRTFSEGTWARAGWGVVLSNVIVIIRDGSIVAQLKGTHVERKTATWLNRLLTRTLLGLCLGGSVYSNTMARNARRSSGYIGSWTRRWSQRAHTFAQRRRLAQNLHVVRHFGRQRWERDTARLGCRAPPALADSRHSLVARVQLVARWLPRRGA